MKIRLGFVSNSSSASYYITIKQPPAIVYKKIYEECFYPYLDKENLLKTINSTLIRDQLRLKNINNKETKYSFLKSLSLYSKSELEKTIDSIKKDKDILTNTINRSSYSFSTLDIEITKLGLKYNGIDIHENKNSLRLSAFSSMHNNYTESIPLFLNEIILFYMFEEPNNINVKIER